jgi:membrane-associated phospholipid phosphatase
MSGPEEAGSEPRPEWTALPGRKETFVGAVLVGWSILGAVAIHAHPQPNGLDRWGFEWIARAPHSATLARITDLGSPAVLAIGSVLAALLCVRRDRRRAIACLAGPLLCALSVEYLLKPWVGRRFEGVLSYPSGTTADLAALATAWILAVPARVRVVFVVIGSVAVGAMVVAVIGLRWHLPSDALAGVVLGVGIVVLADGVLHLRSPGQDRPSHPDTSSQLTTSVSRRM